MRFTPDLFRKRLASRLAPPGTQDQSASADVHPSDTNDLLQIRDDREFLRAAYRRILGRDCDVSGLATYLEALRRHVPRREILARIAESDEARARRLDSAPALTSIRAEARSGPSALYQKLRGRLAAFANRVLRQVLLTRLDSLDYRVNFLLEETSARSDGFSRKLDESFWTLSEKIDALARERAEQSQQELDSLRQELATISSQVSSLDLSLCKTLARLESLQETSAARITLAVLGQGEGTRRQLLGRIGSLDNRLSAFSAQALDRTERVEHFVAESVAVARRCGIRYVEVDGLILGVPAEEWRLAAYLQLRGIQEPGMMRLFGRTVKPGMVIVDIGANLGMFTVQAARLLKGNGRVHSFEPSPRIFQLLHENVQVNGFLESGIVRFHECACTDSEGSARLRVFPENSGHNTIFWTDDGLESVPVRATAVDAVLANEPRIDLVKIDAEGAEPSILRGMVQTIRRNPGILIVLEFAPVHLERAGESPELFLQEIEDLGLEIALVDEVTGDPRQMPPRELLARYSSNLQLHSKLTNEAPMHG